MAGGSSSATGSDPWGLPASGGATDDSQAPAFCNNVDRFDQIVVHACCLGLTDLFRLRVPAQSDDRQGPGGANPACHRQAIHPRHPDVHQHQITGELLQRRDGCLPSAASVTWMPTPSNSCLMNSRLVGTSSTTNTDLPA